MLGFLLLSAIMIVGAVGVISLRQPVHAALSLVGTLLTLAVTYVTLQAHFLAAIQVIVYAGAIMVLFLFVIMLLNIQGAQQASEMKWIRPVAYGVAVLAAAGIAITAFRNASPLPDTATINAALQGGGAAQVGEALFSEFVLPFQLVGILLLTGIIGATSLVQRRAMTIYGEPVKKAVAATKPAKAKAGVAVLERPEASHTEPNHLKPSHTESAPSHDADIDKEIKEILEPDDLKLIKGVGPILEGLLHEHGIYTFAQIAALKPDEIKDLDKKLDFHGRIEREDWVSQAKVLAEGKKQ